MYKVILLIIFLIFIPVQLMAVNNQNIRFTVHNLSYNPMGGDTTKGITDNYRIISTYNPAATEVCIFCHTPHNANSSSQLWNKVSGTAPYDQPTASAYQLYTSSLTLKNTAVRGSHLTADSVSLLCLGCHDGKTAINVLHHSSVSDATDGNGNFIMSMTTDPVFGTPTADQYSLGDIGTIGIYRSNIGATRGNADGTITDSKTGTNLADDHPIGFSYQAAYDYYGAGNNKLRTLDEAKANGVRFYGPARNQVECSTCHDPHVFYGYGKSGGTRVELPYPVATQAQKDLTPFLVRDNNGSAMCLSCHIK